MLVGRLCKGGKGWFLYQVLIRFNIILLLFALVAHFLGIVFH